MILSPVAALLGALTVLYLRFRSDRLSVFKDLRWIVFLWYILTPWTGYQWMRKVWLMNLWSWYRVHCLRQKSRQERAAKEAELARLENASQHGLYRSKFDYNDEWSPMKPVFFPCRTYHKRLFPKKHCFSYSYLFVGIPVGWRGYVRTILSADLRTLPWSRGQPEDGWFNIDSSDYLARGESLHGLRGKLDDYLESQNENIQDYPHAYLVTAPRFLGYSFNPVSFWYLYNSNKELKAMILEVNNTFDEKRIYFLKNIETMAFGPKSDKRPERSPEIPAFIMKQKIPVYKSPGDFTAAWSKDFHVSPFNSRKGTYSLAATDPFANHLKNGNLKASCGKVNNTVTLSSSKNHPKLVARILSTSGSIDPYSLGEWKIVKFVFLWFWVGLVTFPRILWEAGKLFFLRRLHVWFRPEVLKDSMGRNETDDERAIAFLFRDYLQHLVQDSDLPIPVKFIPGLANMPPSETFTPDSLPVYNPLPESSLSLEPEPFIFKPTTPLFYALLARQSDFPTFFQTHLENPDIKTHIFYTSSPDLLLRLFKTPYKPPITSETPRRKDNLSPLQNLTWNLLRHLRTPHSTFSPLDAFAIQPPFKSSSKVHAYRTATFKLFLSDRIAFGQPHLIDATLFGIKLYLYWIVVRSYEEVWGWLWRCARARWGEYLDVAVACLCVGLCCFGIWLPFKKYTPKDLDL